MRFDINLLFILQFIVDTKFIFATNSPDWDKFLAEVSQIEPIADDHDDFHSSFPPIPAYEHAIDPSTLEQHTKSSMLKGRTNLSQDPKNIARRLKYAQDKANNKINSNTSKPLKFKKDREKARRIRREKLRTSEDEEKVREHKAKVAKYNKNYTDKLHLEIASGTISKERKEKYDIRLEKKNEWNKARYHQEYKFKNQKPPAKSSSVKR